MPSETTVTARYSCFSPDDCLLDVAVYPLVEDAGHTEGLCGNYNGDKNDDRRPRNSDEVDNDSEPVKFATSYMYAIVCSLKSVLVDPEVGQPRSGNLNAG